MLSLYLENIDMRIDASSTLCRYHYITLKICCVAQIMYKVFYNRYIYYKYIYSRYNYIIIIDNIALVVTFKQRSESFFWSQECLHDFINVSSNMKLRTNTLWWCFSVSFSKAPTIKLPSSVFATEFEEDVGLLNKAAPVSGIFHLSVMWVAV